MKKKKIEAKGIYYKELNGLIQQAVKDGAKEITLKNVNGQRYIGTRLDQPVHIDIYGVPGNDLGAYMNGSTIVVHDNGQDAMANTMNAGKIVVHGHAGDVLGYAMRGGKLFVKGNVGYRVGIHMKQYKDLVPILVAGGTAGAFFGEYMAGGNLILLGLGRKPGEPIAGDYLGTGMHGGVIYIRGDVDSENIGKECRIFDIDENDKRVLTAILTEYCQHFAFNLEEIMSEKFIKLLPVSKRPYGQLYAHY